MKDNCVEPIGVASCHYDEVEVRPIYKSSSLAVTAFNLLTGKEENHVISFLDLALTVSPDNAGKIDAGYFVHGYDPDSGPYKDWVEVEVEPEEFVRGAYGGHKDFKVSNDLAEIFQRRIDEGVLTILHERLPKK